MNYDDVFARHSRVALQFSTGKDSMAVLHLMRDYLDKLTVYFVNSGDNFPETTALANAVRKSVPNFVEVQGRSNEVRAELGWPSDLVTAGSTAAGRMMGHDDPALIDRYTCCFYSLMQPMYFRMKQDGITLVIRGQKNDDDKKPPLRSGDVSDGFEFLYPIEDWTTEEVFAYIKEHELPLPRFYEGGMPGGPDCMHCTAWLEHKMPQYVKRFHPHHYPILLKRLNTIKEAVEPQFDLLTRTIKEAA